MLPFKFGDKTIQIKNKWEELTLSEFLRFPNEVDTSPLASVNNFYDILSILSGITKEDLMNVAIEDINNDLIKGCMAFLSTPMPKQMPKQIHVCCTVIDVPQDLSIKTHGQFMMFNALCIKEIGDGENVSRKFLWDKAPQALAIYLQPLITGKKFDGDKIDELAETIAEQLPAVQAAPILTFFLNKYSNSVPVKPSFNIHTMRIIKGPEPVSSPSSQTGT